MSDKKPEEGRKNLGVWVGVLGFVLLCVGALVIVGAFSPPKWLTDVVVLLGAALLVVGCGMFGNEWAGTPKVTLSTNGKWSVIATFVATVLVAIMSLWAYSAGNDIWTAVAAGALGGLVHEISQSKGTAFLPDSSPSSADKKDEKKGDEKGESYLGGLLGIILGGAAGLLTLATTSGASSSASSGDVSVQMVVTAFAAGVALKGISDAAASPSKKS